MNKLKRIVLPLLLAAALLSGCGRSGDDGRPALNLWYFEDAPGAGALCALAEQYNARRPRGAAALRLRALEAGTELTALPPETLPELLLCEQGSAQSLAALGLLRPVPEGLAPAYADDALQALPAEGVLPLGAAVPLLCLAGEVQAPTDVEGLLRRAADFGSRARIPYCTADSFGTLFYWMLDRRGAQFHAEESADLQSPAYAEVHNLFAEAAFAHGLAVCDLPAARLVQAGQLPCALVDAPLLPGLELDACRLLPLPGIAPGEDYPARLGCLALCARQGADVQSLSAFLGWLLQAEQWDALTRSAGLAPLRAGYTPGDEPLDALLAELGAAYRLALPGDCRDFCLHRAEFELRLRAALAALA